MNRDHSNKSVMGQTITVARDRAFDENSTIMPTEVARGVYIERAPSAQGLKLLLLLISVAGGRMADDVQHSIRLADLKRLGGIQNHSRESLRALFIELRGAVLVYEGSNTEDEIIGGFIDELSVIKSDNENEDQSGMLEIRWWFGRTFRQIALQSDYWAIIDRQIAFEFKSKYSILLFQHISSLVNLTFNKSKTFTVRELRSVLGVAEGKLPLWADFRRVALEAAINEISEFSRFSLTFEQQKVGRSVRRVVVSWSIKPSAKTASDEQTGLDAGCKTQWGSIAEQVKSDASPAFPSSGSIAYDDYWLKVKHSTSCNLDNKQVADRFRAWCLERGIKLTNPKIATLFANYCSSIPKV